MGLSADYGHSFKGRAHENFNIDSHYLYSPQHIDTSNRVKPRSEVYDFNAAVGYPFTFCNCRLSFIPLIGFSWHRQHLRVKSKKHHSDPCSSSDSSSSDSCSSSSSYISSYFLHSHDSEFSINESSNPFYYYLYSDPFYDSYSSDHDIASALGLKNKHRTSTYRFTWYGFYFGADIAYALDGDWTLFSEVEFHVFDSCHRKRKSWTGVHAVDHYHQKGWAWGIDGVIGAYYQISNCYYGVVALDLKWWNADSHHDNLSWNSLAPRVGFGFTF